MNIDYLTELMDLCVSKRVKQLSIDNNHIVFDDSAFNQEIIQSNAKPSISDADLAMPSDKDLLNWSSPLEEVEIPKSLGE